MRYFSSWRFLVLLILAASIPAHALAAALFFEAPALSPRVGDTITVRVQLDAEGTLLNAVEGTIRSSGPIAITNIREDDSIVPIWVEGPVLGASSTVSFSGIIPGGYQGVLSPLWNQYRPGTLLTLVLKATGTGEAALSFAPGASVLANDGRGTSVPVSLRTLSFSVLPADASLPAVAGPAADADAPEVFIPIIARNPDIFAGDAFLAWDTKDIGSGIDHYEVAESIIATNGSGLAFVRTKSPYHINDQSLGSYLYVKAVDRAGNEYIASLAPVHSWLWYGAAALAILLAVLLGFRYYWKQRSLP